MKRLVTVVSMVMILLMANIVFCQGLDTEVEGTFTNADVSAIVSELASQAGVSVCFDPAVTGKLSIKIAGQTLGSALDEIYALTGYFYGQVGERSLVFTTADPNGPYFKNISETKVVKLKFAKVRQLNSLLAAFWLQYIKTDEEFNQIAITAPIPIIERIEQEIAKFDIEKANIRHMIAILDDSSITNKERTTQFKFSDEEVSANGVRTLQINNISVGYYYKKNGEFLANIFGSKSADKLKIFAQPEITLPEGETGETNFGKTYFVPAAIYYGTNDPLSLKEIPSGTSLKIRSRIIDISPEDQRVELTIRVEASEPVGTGPFNTPVLNRRFFEGTAIVRNGETNIISGLETSTDYEFESKPPILGDIPILGELIKNKAYSH